MHVSASERTVPDLPRDARFWAASSDATKIFFTTAEQLTDEDPNSSSDLYRYDVSGPVGSRLTRVSIDDEPGDNQGNDLANGHDVAGAIGSSADGDTVYFAVADLAGSQLIAGGSTTRRSATPAPREARGSIAGISVICTRSGASTPAAARRRSRSSAVEVGT